MFLSLDRLGWRSDDGVTLVDDLGVARSILDVSPQLWKSLLESAVQRLHERELGTKTGFAELRGRRVCVEVATRVARSAKTSA